LSVVPGWVDGAADALAGVEDGQGLDRLRSPEIETEKGGGGMGKKKSKKDDKKKSKGKKKDNKKKSKKGKKK